MKYSYGLEVVVFICGAVVMILELVGSRILAPYVGTSLYVWTSLIGIILASLSGGYWLGGKIADSNPSKHILSGIIALSALCIVITVLINPFLLTFIQQNIPDIRSAAVVAALLLFTPASFLLGMVSPFAARLKVDDVTKTGITVGTLYALSTVGSITGTFLAGFFLISFFGSNTILLVLAGILVLTSIFFEAATYRSSKIALGAFVLYLLTTSYLIDNKLLSNGIIDVDTNYARVWIMDTIYPANNRPIKLMRINNESSSAVYLDSDELVFPYSKYYRLAEVFHPGFTSTLMIGGAGYSYPKYYLDHYPQADIDVVEIDPGVTDLAIKYFNLKPDPRLSIIHMDGRMYLNLVSKHYDVILGDAFRGYTVPFQLTTREATQRMYDMLTPGGVVILNLIGSLEGENSKLLRAIYVTYAQIFPHIYVYQASADKDPRDVQNIILVASKSEKEPDLTTDDSELQSFMANRWNTKIPQDVSALTDEYAPIEHYTKDLF